MKRNRFTVPITAALLAALAFQSFSVTSQVRPRVDRQIPQTASQANRQSDEFYAQRERNATPEIRQQLEKFRREIRESNLSYTVGYTTAMDRSMDELAGTRIPDDLADQYRRKNALLGWNKKTDSQDIANVPIVDASFRSAQSGRA